MAKKDNNGYIGNPTLGSSPVGVLSRNKNFDTRFVTQNDRYATFNNLMSSPEFVGLYPYTTQSLSTGGGSGATATASLAPGSVVAITNYTGGNAYPTSVTLSFSGGGGTGADAFVGTFNTAPIGLAIGAVYPLYSIKDVIIGNGGGPYSSPPTLSFSTPRSTANGVTGVRAIASASITNGTITSITLINTGSLYTDSPLGYPSITVTGGGLPTNGVVAVLTPVLENGRGYTSPPTITITGGTGSGAVISASIYTGIDSISVQSGGTGYISPPSVQIDGAFLGDTSATASLSGNSVSTISLISGSSRFNTPPNIIVSGGLPPLPTISNNQIAGWFGVYDTNSNWVGFTVINTAGAGGYTVDWGDGTTSSYNSSQIASKQYTTASFAALTSSIYSTSDQFKPVLIKVSLSGSATSFNNINFTSRPNTPTGALGGPSGTPIANWKSIKMAGDQITGLILGGFTTPSLKLVSLETFEYSGSNKITDFSTAFAGLNSLKEVVSLYTTSGSTFNQMFSSCVSLQKIPELDLTNATSLVNTFIGCARIPRITLRNTEKVTTWSSTFGSCNNLEQVNFNMSTAATNLNTMFNACFRLTKIPPITVTNVTTMTGLFQSCNALEEIKFNGTTSKCTSFQNLFLNCYNLKTLPLSLDCTSNTTLDQTFGGCRSLIRVPKLTNTKNVTLTTSMFNACYMLQYVELFDTQNSTSFQNMFAQCFNLTGIPKFNTAKVTTFGGCFNGCSALKTIPLLDTTSCTSFQNMFGSCQTLLEIPFLNTLKGIDFSFMFSGCSLLNSVPLLNLGQATNVSYMFNSCINLKQVPSFNIAQATNVSFMFNGCNVLEYAPQLNCRSAISLEGMFASCYTLEYIAPIDTSRGVTFTSMFQSCYSLSSIPLLDTSRGTTFNTMFQNCGITNIPELNLTRSTSFTNFLVNATTYGGIMRIKAYGINASIDLTNQNMDSVALNEIYTNVSATGAGKTITVTGNWGTPTDNPAIATAKGWTVTG